MKRFWIGVGFLVVLLAGSLFLLAFSGGFCRASTGNLDEACTMALQENWPEAMEKAKISQKSWEENQHFLAAFTDHEPIEQVDALFSELALYGEKRMGIEFAVTCRQLCRWMQAINESHGLSWWTVL